MCPVIKPIIEYLDYLHDLKGRINFSLYDFQKLPNGLHRGKPFIAFEKSGNLVEVAISYGKGIADDKWITPLSLRILPNTYCPYPLWSSRSVGPDEPIMVIEKVDYLPTPGIKMSAREGFVCFWIENYILYQLIAEPSPFGQDAQALISLLEHV